MRAAVRENFASSLRATRSARSAAGWLAMTGIWFRDLAAHLARGLHLFCPPVVQRAQGRPGACCTRGLVCNLRTRTRTRAYRYSGASRPSLRNGFTAYFVLFPENGSFASVIGGTLPANLAPAPRRPNHTTSPYASGAHVYRALSVHRISPHVRDDREAPLIRRETGGVMRLIWVRTKAEYF
jgi:hypothetical protein